MNVVAGLGRVQWGTFPEWIAGVATLGALAVAVFAAFWAKRAASATQRAADHARAQADAAIEQVEVAKKQAAVARAETELQRQHAERSYRFTVETRLDSMAPMVVGRAFPGLKDQGASTLVRRAPMERARQIPQEGFRHADWKVVPEGGLVVPGPPVRQDMDVFVITLTVEFSNIGTVPTRLAFEGNEIHEMTDWRQGEEMRLIPGECKQVHFVRRMTAVNVMQHYLDGTFDPTIDMFDLEYWVRDLGMNVRDTYRFNADLRVFRQVGNDLTAFQAPTHAWVEDVASPVGARLYERLTITDNDESAPQIDSRNALAQMRGNNASPVT